MERYTRKTKDPMNNLDKPIYRTNAVRTWRFHHNSLKKGRSKDLPPEKLHFNHVRVPRRVPSSSIRHRRDGRDSTPHAVPGRADVRLGRRHPRRAPGEDRRVLGFQGARRSRARVDRNKAPPPRVRGRPAAAGVLPKLINLHGWPHPARRARLRVVVVRLPRRLVDGRDPLRRVEVLGHGRGGRGRRRLHELARHLLALGCPARF